MRRNLPVFAAVVATILCVAPARADDATPPQGRLAAGLDNPLAAHSLDELTATRDRPLFSPSRRPPPPAVVGRAEPRAVVPPPPPDLALFGIVVDAEGASAIVRGTASAKAINVRVGDEIDGWKIAQIDERQVVLSLDERSVTFTMFNGGHADAHPVVAHHAARVLELNSRGILTARRVPDHR
jgi:hypothetical protein